MPVDDRPRRHQDEGLSPAAPDLSHTDPEQLVRRRQSPPRPLGVQHEELEPKADARFTHFHQSME